MGMDRGGVRTLGYCENMGHDGQRAEMVFLATAFVREARGEGKVSWNFSTFPFKTASVCLSAP